MIKKSFLGFFLVAIAIIGIGCSEDQLVETTSAPQAISFRTQGGMPELRATGTTPAYVDAFVVYGTDNVLNDGNNLIFDGITVARQANTARSFDYNPKKYFSVGATNGGFVAYSPVSQYVAFNTVNTNPLTNGVSFDYEVVVPDATGNTTQEDLLVAGATISANATTTAPDGGPATTVTMDFKHALARIFVKAESSLSETVTIKNLQLLNLYSKGTFTITPTTDATATNIWSNYDEATIKDYVYALAPSGVAVETGGLKLVTSMEQGMMILPQPTRNPSNDQVFNADTKDFALELTFDVANIKDQKAWILLDHGYPFEAGKQYAINIGFGGAVNLVEINFDIDVFNFTDAPDLPVVPIEVGEGGNDEP
jgi:hypothetical protein